jgi:hypothetical protein
MAVGNKRKKPPSPAQIRARRKFVAMVRARAKAARAAKRNAPATSSPSHRKLVAYAKRKKARASLPKRPARKAVTVRKNGRVLHGAAAQAVLNSRNKKSRRRNTDKRDASHPIEVSHHYRKGPAGYLTPWQRAEKQGQQRLFKMNSRKARGVLLTGRNRRHNDSAADLRATFSGLPQDKVTTVIAPEGTPAHVVAMGELLQLKTTRETIDFDKGEATLAVDAREKLHILSPVGNNGAFDALEDLGEIKEVTYSANKHDGSGIQEYYHDFAEEGGSKPRLTTDREGMLHIKGGSYTIDEVFTNQMRRRNRRRR